MILTKMQTLTEQYLKLVSEVQNQPNSVIGRNGSMRRIWSPTPLVVDDCQNNFPLLLDRKQPLFLPVLETCFFLSGKSDFKEMPEVLANSFWKPWKALAEVQNSWGRFYSTQWRHQLSEKSVFDALEHLIEQLKKVKKTGIEDRKMVVSLWRTGDSLFEFTKNPAVLESCHSTALCFNLEQRDGIWKLDLHHTQRSLDLICGTSSDLIYSGLLLELLAQEVGAFPGKLIFAPVNVHIYENHFYEIPAGVSKNRIKVKLRANALNQILDEKEPKTIEEAKQFVQFLNVPESFEKQLKFELN